MSTQKIPFVDLLTVHRELRDELRSVFEATLDTAGFVGGPMVDEFGWARGELGLAVGAYMLVSAVATFVAGRLADRLSPRALLIGGTLIAGIGVYGAAGYGLDRLFGTWPILFMIGLVGGCAAGIYLVWIRAKQNASRGSGR